MLFLVLFTAWQAWQVRSALVEVEVDLTALAADFGATSDARTDERLRDVQDAADRAHKHSRGPVWWVGSKLPWIGDDITAVRTVSAVADDLSEEALPSLFSAVRTATTEVLNQRGGRFGVDALAGLAPALGTTAEEIDAASDRIDRLSTGGLLDAVRGPVVELDARLDDGAGAARDAAIAARTLPAMLGADGPRRYLVIFQNNAELRAQGGIPGAYALVTSNDGKVAMREQGAAPDIGGNVVDQVDLTREERDLFTTRLAIYPQDITFVPDFPRSAEILRAMWTQSHPGQPLDGVVSLDPVALSYLLRGTGPVRLDSGTKLTADNAVDVLLRDTYLQVADPATQDAIFAEAARRVFDAVRRPPKDAGALMRGLARAASERRLQVWSSHEEQREFEGLAIAGELPTEATARPEVGVYLSDSAADKMSYYLDYRADVTSEACAPDDKQALSVRVRLRSTVPEGAQLPPGTLGAGVDGQPPGVMRHSVYVYAPVEGRVFGATVDGEEAAFSVFPYRGRDVAAVTVDLLPGETRTFVVDMWSGPGQDGAARLIVTPGATVLGHGKVQESAC